jgi:hypothetical protein
MASRAMRQEREVPVRALSRACASRRPSTSACFNSRPNSFQSLPLRREAARFSVFAAADDTRGAALAIDNSLERFMRQNPAAVRNTARSRVQSAQTSADRTTPRARDWPIPAAAPDAQSANRPPEGVRSVCLPPTPERVLIARSISRCEVSEENFRKSRVGMQLSEALLSQRDTPLMAIDVSQIGSWLLAARTRQGKYSQEQAAYLVRTTARTLGTWERGHVSPPTDQFFALVRLYEAEGQLPDLYKSETKALRSKVRELPPEAFAPVERSKHKKRGA